MKTRLSLVIALAAMFSSLLQAQDTTPPTLNIGHTWIEKVGSVIHFKMLLDPRDETGLTPLAAIQFRSKLNSTAPLPANTTWVTFPWVPGQPFSVGFNCTSAVIELRAIDAAGNVSPLQRRTFASPFPFSPAPNLEPKFGGAIPFAGAGIDCRGLFAATFDTEGYGDDILQVDRSSGRVDIRRQGAGGVFTIDSIQLTAGSIRDSAVADFNDDNRPDLAVVVDDTLKVFLNEGVIAGHLQFTETTPQGLATTGIATVLHCAAGDVTREGEPDLVISGVGDDGMGGSVAKIAVLLNNEQFQLSASNNAVARDGTDAGRIDLGDVTGDGWTDVVMVDAVNEELVLFQNKANGSFAGDEDSVVEQRPQRVPTGFALGGLPAESLAVGDVTGDGRADAVITLHYFGATGTDPNDRRDQQMWQFFDGRGAAPLHANGLFLVGPRGPQADSATPFQSHVILQDLTGDRFPEMVFTSAFEPGAAGQPAGGIRAVRLVARLNAQNIMTSFDFTEAAFATSAARPHRLAAGRFSGNSKRDILVANGSDPQLQWVFNNFTQLSKPLDAAVGVTTDSDALGTQGNNGVRSYFEYLNGTIGYSVTFVNNTTTNMPGAFLDCSLPINFSLLTDTTDAGWSYVTIGGVKNIRWIADIPAGTAVSKQFRVRLISGAAGASVTPIANLRQGTVSKIFVSAPVVRIAAPNLTVVPNGYGQPWLFTFKPFVLPENAVALVQTSLDGVSWSPIVSNHMTQSPGTLPVFTLSTTDIPLGHRYFRAFTYSSATGYKYSSGANSFLPATTGLRITTVSPPRSGQSWTFSASQASTAAKVSVRFQSTLTPYVEGSWTDLPSYSATTRSGALWTAKTYNVPDGQRYFRAISAAPGWVDSISTFIGPIPVTATPLILAPFSYFHIDFVDPARHGNAATFYATTPAVAGLSVRFQSKFSDEDDSKWTDLPDGVARLIGSKWTLQTNYMPIGERDFRAISSAPGYIDNTTQVYSFEVLPALLPQIPTYFGNILAPEDQSVQKTGNIPFSLTLFDFNGVQKVTVQYATPGQVFKPILNSNMSPQLDGITYSTTLNFAGAGVYFLRAAVVDGYSVSQTTYSNYVTITVGLAGGSQPPSIGTITRTIVQPKVSARGSVKITARIGDDKQVHQVFLHRLTAEGQYSSTVGEMTKVGTANPSDYTFTHANLLDGTYYYRIVAKDYDGQETVGAPQAAITLTTPPLPPSPVTIDIPKSYRLVGPTVPTGKYNHPNMPYPDQGIVVFNYSGFPPGTSQIYVYRVKDANGSPTFLSTEMSYWWQNITKSSGSFTIKAPFWTIDKTHPFEGEGTYRIVASQGGVLLSHGSGIAEFTVGHAWNLPNTFTTLDYGLYWFKDGKNALRGVSVNQDDDYFVSNKPTVIYVHGWQPDEVSVKRRESWSREDAYKAGVTYNDAKIWKDRGYNVGLFNWNQFGDQKNEGLIQSQTNIYGGRVLGQLDFLPTGHSMLYAIYELDEKNKPFGKRYWDVPGQLSPITKKPSTILGKNVCDLFFDELERCMNGYVPGPAKEFRVIGHSLGTQVVGKTMWDVLKAPERGVPVPTRIALLEIAQSNIGTLIPPPNESFTVNQIQTAFIRELVDAGVALEAYQSTDLASYLGATLSKVGAIHDMAAYSRVRPDHINPWEAAKSHNDIPRWYFESYADNCPEPPAFTYWTYFVQRDYIGKAISARSSDAWIKSLMGSEYWYEQSEGKNTVPVNDDQFELRTGRNQPPRKSWWGL